MSTLNVTRGSDASFVFTWKDVDKAPIDVSGMEVVILDPSTEVAARLSGEITTINIFGHVHFDVSLEGFVVIGVILTILYIFTRT